MRSAIKMVFTAILVLGGTVFSYAADWDIDIIYSDVKTQNMALGANSKGQGVWINDGVNVYIYDGTSVIDISNTLNAMWGSDLIINKNGNVVWLDDSYRVALYNGATSQIVSTNNPGSGAGYDLNDNDQVVWASYYSGVNLYDNGYTDQVANVSGAYSVKTDNSANIAWKQQSSAIGTYDLYYHDASGNNNISQGYSLDYTSDFRINDSGNVVWNGKTVEGGNGVFLCKSGAVDVIATYSQEAYIQNVCINNNDQIAWSIDGQIYLYDGFNTKIMDGNAYAGSLFLNEYGELVWMEGGSGNSLLLKYYDGTNIFQIADNLYLEGEAYTFTEPAFSGKYVWWIGDGGDTFNVYRATLPTQTPEPVSTVLFSAGCVAMAFIRKRR